MFFGGFWGGKIQGRRFIFKRAAGVIPNFAKTFIKAFCSDVFASVVRIRMTSFAAISRMSLSLRDNNPGCAIRTNSAQTNRSAGDKWVGGLPTGN
jgi:hypothetical protein